MLWSSILATRALNLQCWIGRRHVFSMGTVTSVRFAWHHASFWEQSEVGNSKMAISWESWIGNQIQLTRTSAITSLAWKWRRNFVIVRLSMGLLPVTRTQRDAHARPGMPGPKPPTFQETKWRALATSRSRRSSPLWTKLIYSACCGRPESGWQPQQTRKT